MAEANLAAGVDAALANNEQAKQLNGALSPGYDESLFGCFSDLPGCAVSCCFPCIPSAIMKSAMDDRPCTFLDCLCPMNLYQFRQSMRAKYSMGYSTVTDLVTVLCCGCCKYK